MYKYILIYCLLAVPYLLSCFYVFKSKNILAVAMRDPDIKQSIQNTAAMQYTIERQKSARRVNLIWLAIQYVLLTLAVYFKFLQL